MVSIECSPRVVLCAGDAVVELLPIATTGTAAAAPTAALMNWRREPPEPEAIVGLLDMKSSRKVCES